MTRVLLIRTSALGDVICALPAVSDMASHTPGLALDWVCEESWADIPRLHPAVRRVIPVAFRRWRRRLFAAESQREMGAVRGALCEAPYDAIIDVQGLIRSALVARLAKGLRCGFDGKSVREPPAAWLYDRRFAVSPGLHAVERARRLAASALGYGLPPETDYGLAVSPARPAWRPPGPCLVMLHGTARPEKLWDEANWIELGRRAAARGVTVVPLWGSPVERAGSERIATAVPGAVAPPAVTLPEIAGLMADAAAVVGVDTGLAHLAAAVGAPVVAIFRATFPDLNGVIGPGFAANLGGPGETPDVEAAWRETERALASARIVGPWRVQAAEPAAEGRRRFRPSNARAVVHGR